jgi:uncharacterized membrane protein YphA (DoxX/SURF4 family)
VFGLGGALLGLVGLIWGDFALVWQPVPNDLPGRTLLAYLAATGLFLAGVATQWKRAAAYGVALLTGLYATGALLLHVPRVVLHPGRFVTWAGLAEQLALVAGGLVAYAARVPLALGLAVALRRFGRGLFAACLVSFGLAHFVYPNDTAALVPDWLPPDPMFWAYATGIAHWMAALAIGSGVLAATASRALTLMFVVFGILVHAPSIGTSPTSHMSWTANAMNLALIGAAWVIADSYEKKAIAVLEQPFPKT